MLIWLKKVVQYKTKWNYISKVINQKNIKIFESIYKNRKKQLYNLMILKSKTQTFHQHQWPISIKI